MKKIKFIRIITTALLVTSLFGTYAFATTSTDKEELMNFHNVKQRIFVVPEMKEKVEELKAEGMTREEIGKILRAEGFQLKEAPIMDPEMKARVEELKAEGMTREEIGKILRADGFQLKLRHGSI